MRFKRMIYILGMETTENIISAILLFVVSALLVFSQFVALYHLNDYIFITKTYHNCGLDRNIVCKFDYFSAFPSFNTSDNFYDELRTIDGIEDIWISGEKGIVLKKLENSSMDEEIDLIDYSLPDKKNFAYQLDSGRWPEKANEILLSANAKDSYKIGDILERYFYTDPSLYKSDKEEEMKVCHLTVVGFLKMDTPKFTYNSYKTDASGFFSETIQDNLILDDPDFNHYYAICKEPPITIDGGDYYESYGNPAMIISVKDGYDQREIITQICSKEPYLNLGVYSSGEEGIKIFKEENKEYLFRTATFIIVSWSLMLSLFISYVSLNYLADRKTFIIYQICGTTRVTSLFLSVGGNVLSSLMGIASGCLIAKYIYEKQMYIDLLGVERHIILYFKDYALVCGMSLAILFTCIFPFMFVYKKMSLTDRLREE